MREREREGERKNGSITSAKEVNLKSVCQHHLTAADHAAPPTVGGVGGSRDRLKAGAVGHPGQRAEVLHELVNMRGDPLLLTPLGCGLVDK